MSKDYYHLLGLKKDASAEEVKAAFRRLAKQHHPDMPGGNAEKFKEVNEAYQVLSDDKKRQQYDQFGPGFEQMGGGAGGFDFRQGGGASFDVNDLGGMFGDLFGNAFVEAAGGGRGRERRGRHIEMDVSLQFREAAFGVEKNISLRKTLACDVCGGQGVEPGAKTVACKRCQGSGRARVVRQTILGNIQTVTECPDCDGRGQVPEKKCRHCEGTGVTRGQKDISVKIPAGINDGEVLRLSGEGEAIGPAGRPGDLYLTMRVKPDHRFVREGFDVHSRLEVPFSRAALGGSVTVETLDGVVEMKIPAGTQPGTVMRLKARGVPFLKRSGRGDHHVEIVVKVPERLSKEQKRILEKWEGL